MDARGRGPNVDSVGGLGVRFAADVFKFAAGDVEMACVFEICLREVLAGHSKPRVSLQTSFKSAWGNGGPDGCR